jgi:trigger factor
MNVKVEEAGACRRNVTVEMAAAEVTAEFAEITAQYAQHAALPGFRPGRAPAAMVRGRFAKAIAEQVKEHLVGRGFRQAVAQEKIETVSIIDVKEETLADGQPFVFRVTLDVMPAIALPDYQGIPVAGRKVEVTDEEVDRMLQATLERLGRFVDVTGRGVRRGDLALLDFDAACDGQPLAALAPNAGGLAEARDFWFSMDEGHELVPGLVAGLDGAAAGERREVTVDFPANFPEAALAGRKAVYAVQVKGVRGRQPAALDEKLFKQFGVATEAELRTRVRADLQHMKLGDERQQRLNDIVRHLLGNTAFDLPQSVLQEETNHEVYDLVRANTERGVSADLIQTKKEEIFDMAARSAAERIKVRYILRTIARREKIEVAPAEVEARLREMAERSGRDVAQVRADLEKKEALGRVGEEVQFSKTLQWLLERAQVNVA